MSIWKNKQSKINLISQKINLEDHQYENQGSQLKTVKHLNSFFCGSSFPMTKNLDFDQVQSLIIFNESVSIWNSILNLQVKMLLMGFVLFSYFETLGIPWEKSKTICLEASETYGAPLLRALKAFTFSFMSAIVSLSVLIKVLQVALSITAFSFRFTFSTSVFSRALFTDTFYQLENEFTQPNECLNSIFR